MLLAMIDQVLEFWFGEPATTTEELGRKMRRWFMGGVALDAQIREQFGALVERAVAGELDDWAETPRGRLALILLLDQFTRSVYRDEPRMYAGDPRAQALTVGALDAGLDRTLSIEQRQFLLMPLTHAEVVALQDRSVHEMNALFTDAAEFQKPMLAMGIEQTRKYHDVVTRFGRFPHRNKLLGRANAPEEAAFLVDWDKKMRPQGTDKLPG
jgi:uncharacterized protein (DUF924 family)